MSTARSPHIELWSRLGFGALALVVAAWAFGAIAEDVVTNDQLTVLDSDVAHWLHARATPTLTASMLVLTHLHSTIAVGVTTGIAAVILAWSHRWRWLATVVVCVGGGLALNVLTKLAFHRARPTFDDPLLTLSTYSFPSGHVAGSTIFYGLLVAWVFTRTPAPLWRGLAIVGATAMVAGVAFSRMYLGVHYLSDVGAAVAEGLFWLLLCLGALAAFWRRLDA